MQLQKIFINPSLLIKSMKAGTPNALVNTSASWLCPFMEHRIYSYVQCCLVLTIQKCSFGILSPKILKQIEKPSDFTAGLGHRSILSLSWGSWDNILFLWSPWNQIVSKEYTISQPSLHYKRLSTRNLILLRKRCLALEYP